MSLRNRIIIFNAFAVALAFLATGVAVVGFWAAYLPLRQAVADEAQAVDLAQQLRSLLAREAYAATLALAGNGNAAYQSANAQFDRLLLDANRLAADPATRQALDAARAAESRFNARVEEALAQGADTPTSLRLLTDVVLPARDQADTALDQFLDRQEVAARAAERSAAQRALTTTALFVALFAVAGAAGAILSLRLSRHLLTRLSALGAATALVAGGDRDVRVPTPPRGDELDRLGDDFNRMVAQLSAAEAAARRVDELKASFLASVSHDLRTPLTTVKGLLETLLRDDVEWDEAARREFLQVAAGECERLVRLVTNVLDLSRLEAGAWPLEREAVDLAALTGTLVQDLRVPGAALASHQVSISPHPALPHAWADELQVRRVLENLLSNSAKFSPPGTRIEVALGPGPAPGAGPAVTVHVRDRGSGIPADHATLVFEKFYRSPSASRTAPGTGLGLAICRAIVEAHGGRIWVESGASGTDFAFTLPAAPTPAWPAPSAPAGATEPAATAGRAGG